ncbi:MAG: LamG domain-containing protein [Tenericutes bacterium]|nr:LamG domain-containing protein [Mycoplasmatota bacterium]
MIPNSVISNIEKKLHWIIPVLLMLFIVSSVLPPFLTLYERPSFIEDYEYEASQWIKENASRDTLLVSDQASMLFLSGLTDTTTLVHLTQNFPKEYPLDAQRLSLIYQLFLTDNAYKVYDFLSELEELGVTTEEYYTSFQPLENPEYLIVISPRTSMWVDWGGKPVIWYPNNNVYSNKPTSLSIRDAYLTKFFDENLFDLLYADEDKIYIFKPVWSEIFQATDYPGEVGENVDDALLLFDFNEDPEKTLYDKSGNKNDGIIIGTTWSNEETRKALEFDIDDYVLVPQHESLNITEELTLEAWIKPENMTHVGWHTIICKGSNYVYQLLYNDEIKTLAMGLKIGGKPYFVEFPYVPDGVWHHLVGTYKSGEFKIYLDGVLSKSRNDILGSIDTNDEPLTVGNRRNSNNAFLNHWNGSIGEIRIYNRILMPDEITAHFEGNPDEVYTIRRATVRENDAGYMVEKSLELMSKEETEIKMNVMISDNSSNMTAFRWELFDETTGTFFYSKDVKVNEFSQANTYEYIKTTISISYEPVHNLQLRIYFADNVDVSIKKVFVK